MATLGQALGDANPAMRLVASRALAEVPRPLLGSDLPTLRRLLRDSSPQVKIAAAGALLKLAGGVD
jgi:vesicle coat complex subunit